MKGILSYVDTEANFERLLIIATQTASQFRNSENWVIHFSVFPIVTFLSCKMSANSFAKLMECAARESNTTYPLLTLCPGCKIFTPCLF